MFASKSFSIFFNYLYYVYFSSNIFNVPQVFSLADGPGHNVWRNLRVPVIVLRACDKRNNIVDWLKYDCYSNFYFWTTHFAQYKCIIVMSKNMNQLSGNSS